MNALKWYNLSTRMVFYPDDGGGAGPTPSGSGGGGDGGSSPGSSPGSSVAGSPASPDGGGGGGGASPASPAPAGSPAPATPAAPALDWSALGSADDLDSVEIPAEVPAPEPPVAPPAQPVEAPKPVTPAEPAAPTTPPGQPGAQPEAPRLSASDPMGIAAGLEANRDAVLEHLVQTKFAMSEKDIQELETDAAALIPRVMARVFFESQVSMQKFLAQAVPGMVRQYNTVSSANETAEKQFFAAHKALNINDPSHRATAVRIASVYRQANPTIPLQQLIAEVGPMVVAALRINGHAAPVQTPAAAPQRAAAAAFRPAVGGAGASPTPEPVNEWMGLGREYD